MSGDVSLEQNVMLMSYSLYVMICLIPQIAIVLFFIFLVPCQSFFFSTQYVFIQDICMDKKERL